jgi:hypothetical protein
LTKEGFGVLFGPSVTVGRRKPPEFWVCDFDVERKAGFFDILKKARVPRLRAGGQDKLELELQTAEVEPLVVRLGPGRTAWDRINFFAGASAQPQSLHPTLWRKRPVLDCGGFLQGHNPWGWAAWGRLRKGGHQDGRNVER